MGERKPMSRVGEDKLGAQGDVFYERLLKVHEGLSDEQSHRLNMRLVLLMANAIGKRQLLDDIFDAAMEKDR